MHVLLVVVVCLFASGPLRAADASKPSDRAYRNGVIFTADAMHDTAQAIAIHDGRIVYVGPDSGLDAWIGPSTELVDLHWACFLMPGIVDGHMHPLQAGAQLLKCRLDYASLTVRELQARVQTCLDERPQTSLTRGSKWSTGSRRACGRPASPRAAPRSTRSNTKRPIIVRSSFGHTVLANTRALQLANITADTKDPVGGKIWRDAAGEADRPARGRCVHVFETLLPQPTAADNVRGRRGRAQSHARARRHDVSRRDRAG